MKLDELQKICNRASHAPWRTCAHLECLEKNKEPWTKKQEIFDSVFITTAVREFPRLVALTITAKNLFELGEKIAGAGAGNLIEDQIRYFELSRDFEKGIKTLEEDYA